MYILSLGSCSDDGPMLAGANLFWTYCPLDLVLIDRTMLAGANLFWTYCPLDLVLIDRPMLAGANLSVLYQNMLSLISGNVSIFENCKK